MQQRWIFGGSMQVGDLVREHIDDQVGIIIAEDLLNKNKFKYFKVLFPSGIIGTFSETYLEVA